MDSFNIYLCGVGGQGIGLLNEVLIRAAEHAGHDLKGVDTHGLAQRGGIVQSHLKLGEHIYSPIVSENDADMVIALEIHEAYRAIPKYLKNNGKLVYYNTEWQPSEVRLVNKGRITVDMINEECKKRNVELFQVFAPEILNSKMQNIAIIAAICKNKIIPKIKLEHYEKAMQDSINPKIYDENIKLFRSLL